MTANLKQKNGTVSQKGGIPNFSETHIIKGYRRIIYWAEVAKAGVY